MSLTIKDTVCIFAPNVDYKTIFHVVLISKGYTFLSLKHTVICEAM